MRDSSDDKKHSLESFNAPLVHKILETGLTAVIAAPVVSLCGHDRLDCMEDVLLVYVPQRIGQPRECLVSPVSSAHATPNNNIVALDLAGNFIWDDNNANVVGEKVNTVIPRDSHGDLELAWEELSAIDRLWAVLKVCSEAIISSVLRNLRILWQECLQFKPSMI